MPLYTAGARVIGIYSTSVIVDNLGLNITLFSYEDRIDFGLHMDPDLVDDPWELAEGIPLSLEELFAASGLGSPSSVTSPFGDDEMPGAAAKQPAPKKRAAKKRAAKRGTKKRAAGTAAKS
jgi:hypothetical protein